MTITGMNHFTVLTTDLDKSKAFYVSLLGLTEGYRPPFEFPGAWLYCGDQAILHIMTGRPVPNTIHGIIDHIAFSACDLQSVIDRLNQHNIAYTLNRLKGLESWQLFCTDPDGAKVELDFSASEPESQNVRKAK